MTYNVNPPTLAQLTYSMVKSPSWEANWFAASQEISHISQNPKVHYTGTTISYFSTHCMEHKMAAYRYLIACLHLLPLSPEW